MTERRHSFLGRLLAAAFALVGLTASNVLATGETSTKSPYLGEEYRAIKSLSAEDVEDLLSGRGWGQAKPAELNGYPGPRHVLDLANKLSLSSAQQAAIERIFEAMQAQAMRIGHDYVATERALDDGFRSKQIDRSRLVKLTEEAAQLRAKLRQIHLQAHLETAPLLNRHQHLKYAKLRGYRGAHEPRHQRGGD